MVDKTFYKNAGPFTLSKISEFLNSKYAGNKEKIISDIAPVDDASQNEICFVSDKYKDFIINQMQGLLLLKIVNSLQMKKILFFLRILILIWQRLHHYFIRKQIILNLVSIKRLY